MKLQHLKYLRFNGLNSARPEMNPCHVFVCFALHIRYQIEPSESYAIDR